MSRLLLDTSVLIKWFHAEGEAELGEARILRSAHVNGDLDVHMIDLALYEIGNVLLRALSRAEGSIGERSSETASRRLGRIANPGMRPPQAFAVRVSSQNQRLAAKARPVVRPVNKQPPRKVPSSAR